MKPEKKILWLALVITAAFGFASPCSAGWQLVWSDEFNGSSINTQNWNLRDDGTGGYVIGCMRYASQYYSTDNLSVQDGYLRIATKAESRGGKQWTSGGITNQNKGSFGLGRVEIRARLPKGRGIWPALWLNQNASNNSIEIDIMELLGHQPQLIYLSSHYWGSSGHQFITKNFALPAGNFSDDFHVFGVDVTGTANIFYVDGAQVATISGYTPVTASGPLILLINTAVGDNWPGYPDGSTVFPQYMDVDYVRYYTQSPNLVELPVITPYGGAFLDSVWVTMACATTGATIRYTTNGSDPTAASPLYTAPFPLTATTTVKAKAFKTGLTESSLAAAVFTRTVATPVITPNGGRFADSVTVGLMCATSGATIRYTTNFTDPTSSSALYSGPLKVKNTTTVSARAFKSGLADSPVSTAAFTIAPDSCSVSSFVWQNKAMATRRDTFTVEFNVVTSAVVPVDGQVSLSQNPAFDYNQTAVVVRFNNLGQIDVYNGSAYAAAARVAYTANKEYHFRVRVDVPAHRYSVYVTPAGGTETVLALNYAFRTEQAGATQLNMWNVFAGAGQFMVCGFHQQSTTGVHDAMRPGSMARDANVRGGGELFTITGAPVVAGSNEGNKKPGIYIMRTGDSVKKVLMIE